MIGITAKDEGRAGSADKQAARHTAKDEDRQPPPGPADMPAIGITAKGKDGQAPLICR
ncbi:MAG TPA: hypothetical protein VNJ28_03840 [Candidatus Limnocylindrales bacterium]|nr:hypothetical protein [Candidatus Limnocylindrales bacterium]